MQKYKWEWMTLLRSKIQHVSNNSINTELKNYKKIFWSGSDWNWEAVKIIENIIAEVMKTMRWINKASPKRIHSNGQAN